MTTEVIWINEYRTNLTSLWKKAQKENIRYIVLVNNKPVFEVNPMTSNVIEERIDHNIYELPKEEITNEIKDLISKSKNKDLSQFQNI